MILVAYAAAIAVAFGVATRGSLRELGRTHLRGEWLLLSSLVLQALLPALLPSGLLSDEAMVAIMWFLPGTMLLLRSC